MEQQRWSLQRGAGPASARRDSALNSPGDPRESPIQVGLSQGEGKQEHKARREKQDPRAKSGLSWVILHTAHWRQNLASVMLPQNLSDELWLHFGLPLALLCQSEVGHGRISDWCSYVSISPQIDTVIPAKSVLFYFVEGLVNKLSQ